MIPRDKEPDVLDYVCTHITSDWQKLARWLQLTDAEISNIDLDYRKTQEKCHQAIRTYRTKGMDTNHLASVEQALKDMERNDILMGIHKIVNAGAQQANNPPNHQRNGINFMGIHQDDVTQQNAVDQPLLVTDLKLPDLETIIISLDCIGGANYERLMMEFEGMFTRNDISQLSRFEAGGGNPADHFLLDLKRKYPDTTLADVRAHLVTIKRLDIVRFLDHTAIVLNQTSIEQAISMPMYEGLCDRLNGSRGDVPWRLLAGHFGYNMAQVTNLESTIRENNSYSPTRKLFRILSQRRADLTLDDLAQKFVQMQRNDLVNKIDKFKQELVASRRT